MLSRRGVRHSPRLPFDHGEPIWRCRYDMIGVPIVLLAATLIWVDWPVKTHAVTVSLVSHSAMTRDRADLHNPPEGEITNTLSITREDTLLWNGQSVSTDDLRRQLDYGLLQDVEPQIVFLPDGDARYGTSLRIIALVRQSGVTKFCFGDLEKHRRFAADVEMPRLMVTYIIPKIEPIRPLANPPSCSGFPIIHD